MGKEKKLRIFLLGVLLVALAGTANAAQNFEMVFIKGGCYQMGDTFGDGGANEKPVHKVCIDDFYIGKYVVTQAQWQALMGNNPSRFKKCGGNCPVENILWEDAQEFIRRLNDLTGKNYRLPYEAEWEYAARSGGKQELWAGTSDLDKLGDYAWFEDNSGEKTHSIGTRRPNGLGLYDMTGNVWEWCKDWYDGDYYKRSPEKNPHGPLSGSARVIRGGGWGDAAGIVRAVSRDVSDPSIRCDICGVGGGFRLVLPAVQ
jgi:formylglycine-generating enzyme required for sulfatase activity